MAAIVEGQPAWSRSAAAVMHLSPPTWPRRFAPDADAARGERPLPAQFAMFCVVGLGNVTVDALVFASLVWSLALDGHGPLAMASAVGFVAGAGHSFFWNSRVTFRGRRPGGRRLFLLRFLPIVIGGGLIAGGVSLATLTVWPYEAEAVAAKGAAMAATLGWNFSLARQWVFARRR
ncbi:MAG: GtrA family protein [Dehalococcoidia bacterium]